jgi:hypothetical protein
MGWIVSFPPLLLYTLGKCSPYTLGSFYCTTDVTGSSDRLQSINETTRCPIPEKISLIFKAMKVQNLNRMQIGRIHLFTSPSSHSARSFACPLTAADYDYMYTHVHTIKLLQ